MLKELLKSTEENDIEYDAVEKALELMKATADMINEDKRNMEELVELERRFEGWQGPPITVVCSKLIMNGTCSAMKRHKRFGSETRVRARP